MELSGVVFGGEEMIAFVLRRLIAAVVLISLLSFVLFALLQAMPGSMEDMLLASNPNTRPEDVARLKRIRGLNKPLHEQYVRWMFGYFDRTGGQDELILADGTVIEGRMVDESGAMRSLPTWKIEGAEAILDNPPDALRFLVSSVPDGAEIEVDRVHSFEGSQRLIRRQTDLGRPIQGAHLFKPTVGDGDQVKAGDELGVFYAIDERTMVSLGAKPIAPEENESTPVIDPVEALAEAGSNENETTTKEKEFAAAEAKVKVKEGEEADVISVTIKDELAPILPAPDCIEHGVRVQKALPSVRERASEGVDALKSPLDHRLADLIKSGDDQTIVESEKAACLVAAQQWGRYVAVVSLGTAHWRAGKGLTVDPSTAVVLQEDFKASFPDAEFLNWAIADRLVRMEERDKNRLQDMLRQRIAGRLVFDAKRIGVLKASIDGWPALMSPFVIDLSQRVDLAEEGDEALPLASHQVTPWSSMGLLRAGERKAGFISGDLGWSRQQERVSVLIKEAIVNTLRLMAPALLLSILIALPLGIVAAVRQYSWLDHSVNMGAFLGISLPVHWFGLMLIHIFAVSFGLFPVSGIQTPGLDSLGDKIWYTILPATVLSIAYIGRWLRYMRASMLEVIRQDYIRTARAKGLSERRVIMVHALRNALIPVVTILAMSIPVLFSGALITETVFSWPGMGSLIFNAIITFDYYVAIVGFLISATLVMLGNLLADILYAIIDPRVRLG